MRPEFDARDAEILRVRQIEFDEIPGARVGDFVKMLDGSERRFTHDWGDGLQTTCGQGHPCYGDASFYFGGDHMSFSGSLDRAIPRTRLRDTGETKDGRVWFFHHHEVKAHNAVFCFVKFRVFEVLPVQEPALQG